MKYYQDPINGKFYSVEEAELKLKALEQEQALKKKDKEAKLAAVIWFINGCLIGWLIIFWGLRCF